MMPSVNKILSKVTVIALTGLLLSCTTPKPSFQTAWQAQTEIADFTASGRLSARADEQGLSASFDWTRENQVETLDIVAPLGITVGQLCQDKIGVLAINADGEQFTAENPQVLSKQLIGYELPVQYLHIWAHGQWAADLPHEITSDGILQQGEWMISRIANQDGSPRVLNINNQKVSLRLVFNSMEKTISDGIKSHTCEARG